MGKEKVPFTLTFYFKKNKALQLDLQRFEIFTFSSLLPGLPPGKMLEQKLRYGFSRFGICVHTILDQVEMVYYLFQVITQSDLGENQLSIPTFLHGIIFKTSLLSIIFCI